ncbi:hypothetical protein MMAG44476_13251 [Mycolicibacterium mageritense DSM 44476 = CIP 104973]|uniref:DUF5642 domain-containing protein n=1 Tax=Mycolicibacterium mageritense TaxID=53462 RepID=A0AAI8XLY0_MYCME|nr:hypothetical protein MMAGJ_34970 [Mycolicibacterium mageritense]BDY27267.1 hypothetical protein hbim_01189 [Mycolicibacterium mageritense]CDO21264.1 hypothetical protein BN978_01724 [Mycolicibacterium mageritense DSM 44476 = CIP 104973]
MSFPPPTPRKFLFTFGMATVIATAATACSSSDVAPTARWGMTPTTTSSSTAPAPSTSASAAPQKADYNRLLLRASDVSIPPDTYTAQSSKTDPNGIPGASALFVNQDDTRAIADTVVIYPDAATATATLRQAAGAVSTIVTGGTPQPFPVGTDGTVISGTSPDGAKAVTLLMFTEGRALVRLEFDSAPGDVTSPQVVTAVGRMQEIALRIGFTQPE